jgi:hypothetical protein
MNGSSQRNPGGQGMPPPPPPLPWQQQQQQPPPSPEPEPEEQHEPAQFPEGFWHRLDYMLHDPWSILESLRRDLDLWRMARIFFAIAVAMAAIYGAVMGATNLLQASGMETGGKFLMILTSAIKVPVLFLFTLVIIVPTIYVANTFVGPRLEFRQVVTVLLASVAVTAIILASTATIALFFALTTRSYHFIKLLHVVFFAYAGIAGMRFFQKSMRAMAPVGLRGMLKRLFFGTLVLYVIVGTQLAWVLRPFVGDPDMDFMLFRPRYGNFYESVWHATKGWWNEQFGTEEAVSEPAIPDETDSGGQPPDADADDGRRGGTD